MMGRFDKDRYFKELSVRHCLQIGLVPFCEVVVSSSSDLSDSVEVLTDVDVLGVGQTHTGAIQRIIFDCKSSGKLSAIGRAFWAEGLRSFTSSDEAFVIMKSAAVHNHRISAMQMGIDLHDEASFLSLGQTIDPAFPSDVRYQSSLARWDALEDVFSTTQWTAPIYEVIRNAVPLSRTPWATFRKTLAELRTIRGELDPGKAKHVAIFLDVMSAVFVLWASMGTDIRRIYQPKMTKVQFETALRYYLWGGKEGYRIRQQISDSSHPDRVGKAVELPAWAQLVDFAGTIISGPQLILNCSILLRDCALRAVVGPVASLDQRLKDDLRANPRALQFALSLSEYLIAASGTPKDMQKAVQKALTDVV